MGVSVFHTYLTMGLFYYIFLSASIDFSQNRCLWNTVSVKHSSENFASTAFSASVILFPLHPHFSRQFFKSCLFFKYHLKCHFYHEAFSDCNIFSWKPDDTFFVCLLVFLTPLYCFMWTFSYLSGATLLEEEDYALLTLDMLWYCTSSYGAEPQ